MTRENIVKMQKKIGVEPDGFWGPKSVAACQRYLRGLMPTISPWPQTDQHSLTKFFGAPGDENQHSAYGVAGLGVKYEGREVKKIMCNIKVGDSLLRILKVLSKSHPEILADYAGCYNNRFMRGGSLPSLHARAAAVDFVPGANGNKVHWPTKAAMPLEVMEAFSREGWVSAGAFWSRDAMHFQATQ